MIGVAERGYADRLALEILDRLNLASGFRRGNDGEQRQPSGNREATDIGADIDIGLHGDVQSGGRIVDRTADQRLHRRIAAAGVDELHVEAMVLEIPVGARDFIGHPA